MLTEGKGIGNYYRCLETVRQSEGVKVPSISRKGRKLSKASLEVVREKLFRAASKDATLIPAFMNLYGR